MAHEKTKDGVVPEPDPFAELVAQLGIPQADLETVVSLAYRLAGDAAPEVITDAMADLVEAVRQAHGTLSALDKLRILRAAVRKYARERWRLKKRPAPSTNRAVMAHDEVTPERRVLDREILLDVAGEYPCLPPLRRRVFDLHQAGHSAKQIAMKLGRREDAVRQALARARKQLHDATKETPPRTRKRSRTRGAAAQPNGKE